MITAMHLLIHSDDAAATRAFLRDVMLLEAVSPESPDDGSSSADDWLIFAGGPCEVAVHPTGTDGEAGTAAGPRHSISLMCDDLAETMGELAGRGAVFAGEPEDRGWGIAVALLVPGAQDILLYEPRHATAYARGLQR
ncbi:hypothetical protein GA0111570_10746 [Raineyella antarctica]|uniref:VOC domain-containing protein n=1 Tax=Raineyella antarctica TaxID=1577474 RepID=A0A1G6H7J9_9ACTN|nr:hypothetical protein [Raineyella antarctica]SDB89925.1 hypothetical protein GA0111570_10746 [Raineyella antarctica]